MLHVTINTCTNVTMLCFFLYCECRSQCGSALFCDNLNACPNVTVFCCVLLSVPVPIWQYSVVLFCECL